MITLRFVVPTGRKNGGEWQLLTDRRQLPIKIVVLERDGKIVHQVARRNIARLTEDFTNRVAELMLEIIGDNKSPRAPIEFEVQNGSQLWQMLTIPFPTIS